MEQLKNFVTKRDAQSFSLPIPPTRELDVQMNDELKTYGPAGGSWELDERLFARHDADTRQGTYWCIDLVGMGLNEGERVLRIDTIDICCGTDAYLLLRYYPDKTSTACSLLCHEIVGSRCGSICHCHSVIDEAARARQLAPLHCGRGGCAQFLPIPLGGTAHSSDEAFAVRLESWRRLWR